jgi:hypothetical protein
VQARSAADTESAKVRRCKEASINVVYDGHWRGGAVGGESRVVKNVVEPDLHAKMCRSRAALTADTLNDFRKPG